MIGRCFSNYKRLPLKDGPRILQGMGKERRRRSNGNLEVFIVDQVDFKRQWCEEGHLAASLNTGFFSFLGPNGTVLPINYDCSQSLLDSVFLGAHLALLNSCSSSPCGEHVTVLSRETEPRSCMTLAMFRSFIHPFLCVCMHMPWCACEGQKTTCESPFYSSTYFIAFL